MRYLVIAFLLFWLVGWGFGFVFALSEVLSGFEKGGPPDLFLIVWLAMWTIGGGFAIFFLYKLISGPREERMILSPEEFQHTPGGISYEKLMNPFHYRNKNTWDFWSELFGTPETHSFKTNGLPEFVLEKTGGGTRLYYDDGADRIEIGRQLREPEVEWLHEVLEDWKEKEAS